MKLLSLRVGLLVAAIVGSSTASAALYDRGNGLIYDDVLDVTWLKDANYAKTSGYDADGRMDWTVANAWANNLVYCDYDDWRLPTVSPNDGIAFNYRSSYDGSTDIGDNITSITSEMSYMFYVNLSNSGQSDIYGNLTGCGGNCLTNTGVFDNIQQYIYWYSTPYFPDLSNALEFSNANGKQGYVKRTYDEFFAWAVRDGDVTVVPELLCEGFDAPLDNGAVSIENNGTLPHTAILYSVPRYTITDLGTFGGSTSHGNAISENGQVTGHAIYCEGCREPTPSSTYGYARAFVTDSKGNLVNLGTLNSANGSSSSYSQAINDSGQVTGYVSNYSYPGTHAFITDSNRNMIDLGTLGGKNTSYGSAINDKGQVIGNSYTIDHDYEKGDKQAFVTDSNRNMIFLTLGGTYSFAMDINDNGQVTGTSDTADGDRHAFVTDSDGNIADLGTFRDCGGWGTVISKQSYGYAINNSGQVTGYSKCLGNGYTILDHAFVTDNNGNMIDLGTLGGTTSIGIAINDSGQVIGYARNADSYPKGGASRVFVTDRDRNMFNLRELIDGFSTNWKNLGTVKDINNDGYITGYGTTIDGFTHAYLLAPIAAPSSPRISVSTNGLNVTLTWSSVNGASGYELYYAPFPYNAERDRIDSLDLGNKKAFSAELWKGAAFYVAVRSYNSAGKSDYSNIVQFSLK